MGWQGGGKREGGWNEGEEESGPLLTCQHIFKYNLSSLYPMQAVSNRQILDLRVVLHDVPYGCRWQGCPLTNA